MADDIKTQKLPHNLILKDRHELSVSGVLDVDSFDEQAVVIYTDSGELSIQGTNLHINKINLDSGDLTLDGHVSSLVYSEKQQKNQGLFAKLFK